MVSVNKIIVVGNLGSEPEMRFTPNGKAVTSFSVAVNSIYTSNGEKKQETEWLAVQTWGKSAESCNQYLHKGALVYVEGRLHTHTWSGQDGVKHSRNEIIANNVSFLDKKHVDETKTVNEVEPEDLPF
jgi:single-strand DNA-binding protein